MNKALYISALLGTLAVTAHAANAPTPAAATTRTAAATKAKAWSPYQPVAEVETPAVKNKQWVRTPVDTFILAQLEDKGLKPSKDADRATFIRRATLDAWGLLPTPQEVQAFVNDKSPNAYEKLVDRLLSSHHFGERQARRWLDLARYADSTGFQQDRVRPNNWRYRDYVINAFNEDKPFNRFIQEQLAGDELWPDDQNARIATGFLAGYPDNYNSRDLVQRKYQIETDMTDMVGEVFLASTIGCARCHNHKADRISQKEYFQLQAFFSNTVFNERTPLAKGTESEYDKTFAQAQAAYQDATKPVRDRMKAILDTVRDAGRKYHNERYLTDSRDSIFKPQEQWNALDKWVNWRKEAVASENDIANYLEKTADKGFEAYNAANEPLWAEYKKLQAELKKFDHLRPAKGSLQYTTALELTSTEVPPTHVRFGGIHERPLDAVNPAIPALWGGKGDVSIQPTATSSGRRTALAQWLSSDNNPLTARVYVNRVWAQYFDQGIVSTVADFGRAGTKPTHPQLLDHLAKQFVKNGWSVKKLHREILLSSVYRQASDERTDVAKVDPENKLLAVYPRKRVEAEVIRDALLYASGLLVDKVGGPAVHPPILVNGAERLTGIDDVLTGGSLWPVSADKSDWYRRSIYVFTRRSFPYPVTENFDPANPNQPHHKRDVTTTPLQALTLFNSDVVYQWSQALAGRVINEAGYNEAQQIDRLYEILFSRKPNKTERTALQGFLKEQQIVVRQKAAKGQFEVAVPTGVKDFKNFDPVKSAAFVDLVHTVANANDFAYRF